MEQLSNILFYAQDCDVHVLEDLYTWLNDLGSKGRVSGVKSSSATASGRIDQRTADIKNEFTNKFCIRRASQKA